MGSELAQKLTRLAACPNLALVRWTSTTKRVGGMYIPLPELRLNILTSIEGVVHLSVSAPVLVYEHGRPKIVFYDDGLMLVTEGNRKGINLPPEFLRKDEKAVKLKGLTHKDIGDDAPKALSDKIMTMGTAPTYPELRLLHPDVFRITKHPENIRPIYTAAILKAIGAMPEDTPEQLHDKFMGNILQFASQTDDGLVFNNEIVASGGMPCVKGCGISRTSGSMVIQLPLATLKDDLKTRGWRIHLDERLEESA